MNWIMANWDTVALIVLGALNLASMVTGLTPSPKDDEFVKKLIGWFSLVQPKNATGTMKLPFTGVK